MKSSNELIYRLIFKKNYGAKQGAEAILHCLSIFLDQYADADVFHHPELDKYILLVDFANAFNSIDRGTMLAQVWPLLPLYL